MGGTAQTELVADLIIAPSGHAEDCKIVSSSLGLTDAESKFCKALRSSDFAPAIDAGGNRVYGKIEINFVWTSHGELSQPLISDVDLSIEHLPPGVPIHPRTQLALTIDPQGNVNGCAVAQSSGVEALDNAACKAGVETASIQAVTDAAKNPTLSVQSLVVGFGAYANLIVKKDPSYAYLGIPGPYFPDRALRNDIGGYADLVCTANDKGELTNCSVDEEAPLSFGFGLAALHMADAHWIQVAAGEPGQVLVRIDFTPPPAGRRR